MQVSTIIVSYNTFELTAAAIDTARTSSPEIEQEIIVVDNDSPDDSGKRLTDVYRETPEVTIMCLESNRGFAGGNNVGAEQASGEVLFFLNPDTEVHPGAVSEIYRFLMANRNVGAVGPRVINPDGSNQQSVTRALGFGTLFKHYFPLHALFRLGLKRDAGSPSVTQPVEMVKGCAIAVRRDAYDLAGGWDESYFLYAEEGELCYQLKNHGFDTYFLSSATVMHYGGASTIQDDYAEQQILQQQSALRFLRRHHSGALVISNRIMGSIGFACRICFFRIILLFERDPELRSRYEAARRIFRWFRKEYSYPEMEL